MSGHESNTPLLIDRLFEEFFERGLKYFFPFATFEPIGSSPDFHIGVVEGVIGSEYACTFAALGIEFLLIDGRRVLLPFLDAEISRTLADAMVANGIKFRWDSRVTRCDALAV